MRFRSSVSRLALAGALFAACAAPALAQTGGAVTPAAYAERARAWAQAFSDLPPDPDVRFGVLPNGMKYAIRRNATPSGQTSLRLRIGSGALEESDDEQGLAHFLEHMSFKGSTHVPNGDMIRILERHGLAFGADTNAQTEETQTVFELDLPQSDADSLSTGLMLLREIGSELTIPAGPMDTERGVVLSEERLRDTPDYEAFKAQWRFLFQDQLIADRLPIGKVPIIKSATPDLLRRYYRANYRPDRATLVVVGDIDPVAMEKTIRARYGDWAPVGPETAAPDTGAPLKRGETAGLIIEPGAPPSVTVNWAEPFDTAPDTFAHEKRDLVEQLAFATLNRRLSRLAHGDAPPFLAAEAGRSNEELSARITSLRVEPIAGRWRDGLAAAVGAERQAVQYGFTPAEVARELTEMRLRFQNAAAGAATRTTPALADEIVRTVDEQQVETSPAQDLQTFDRAVAGLTPEALRQALAAATGGSGPLVFLTSPTPVEGGEAALKSAFDAAVAAPVAPPVAAATARWTHTDFGAPGRVAERRDVADLHLTFVRFADGLQLVVKPTRFSQDRIEVAVHFGRGREGLSRVAPSAWWTLPAFTAGGLADLSYEDLQQVFADRTLSASLSLGDDSFVLGGVTRPEDLPTQMQLLAAYFSAPGFRPEAFQRRKDATALALAELPSTPEGIEARDLPVLERSGDLRWALPTAGELAAAEPGDLRALLQGALAAGPKEVIVVGDVSVDQAIAAVSSTLAALPAAPLPPLAPGADRVAFAAPASAPVVRRHQGRSDQAIAFIGWPAPDQFQDMQEARVLNMTADILGLRLIDQVRIAEGATYSPVARTDLSESFPGFGFLYGSVETPPAKLDHFYADAAAITAAMARTPPGLDELDRARRPHVEQILKAQQTDGYWLAMLHEAQIDPRRLQLIRESAPGYARVTPEDVRAAAVRYLDPARAWRFEVAPEHPAPAEGGGATPMPAPRPAAAAVLRGPATPRLPTSARPIEPSTNPTPAPSVTPTPSTY